jgi:hypothetical protein
MFTLNEQFIIYVGVQVTTNSTTPTLEFGVEQQMANTTFPSTRGPCTCKADNNEGAPLSNTHSLSSIPVTATGIIVHAEKVDMVSREWIRSVVISDE